MLQITIDSLKPLAQALKQAAQTAQRSRFKQANDYAKAAMADAQARAIYEKRAKKAKRSPFRVAFSDYFQGNDLLAKK